MVITLYNLKILLSLLLLSHLQFQNFTNLPIGLFGIFLEIVRHCVSIIITIISNITVLVSYNVIYFGCFIPMSQGVNKKALPIAFPTHPLSQVFTRFVAFQEIPTLLTLICSGQIITKKNKNNKKIILFSTCCWSVLILLFCVYVFLRVLFHSSTIMKLQIPFYFHICIASYLASHQTMSHKTIHDHGLKITACCCFFSSGGN